MFVDTCKDFSSYLNPFIIISFTSLNYNKNANTCKDFFFKP